MGTAAECQTLRRLLGFAAVQQKMPTGAVKIFKDILTSNDFDFDSAKHLKWSLHCWRTCNRKHRFKSGQIYS